ncbi:hypothetical protein Tco_1082584 [Tanacetum coccineum]|uniref:Uncharacterized protein n=1 Tax=Tanacetum coccineum TaxID=301880 RepID=A0ABQ5I1P8_9ASTR
MDDPSMTMEEYIKYKEEKVRRRGKVFNWQTATYGKIKIDDDLHDLSSVEAEAIERGAKCIDIDFGDCHTEAEGLLLGIVDGARDDPKDPRQGGSEGLMIGTSFAEIPCTSPYYLLITYCVTTITLTSTQVLSTGYGGGGWFGEELGGARTIPQEVREIGEDVQMVFA